MGQERTKRLGRRARAVLAMAGATTPLLGLMFSPQLAARPSVPALQTGTKSERFDTVVQPFLTTHCLSCHSKTVNSAGLNLEGFTTEASLIKDPETWRHIVQRVSTGQMPPVGSPRPAATAVKTFTNWVNRQLEAQEKRIQPESGRVTARRLNRAEYNNTVRDLLGVTTRPADDFPQDDSGYGFDNIGDVLSLSPPLMEKYLATAEKVARTAIFGQEKLKPSLISLRMPRRETKPIVGIPAQYDETGLTEPHAVHVSYRFPVDGEYAFRVVLTGQRPAGADPMQLALWIDGKKVHELTFDPHGSATFPGEPQELAGLTVTFPRTRMAAGEHWMAVTMPRMYEGLPASYGGPNPSKQPEPVLKPRFLEPPKDATPEDLEKFKERRARFEMFMRESRKTLPSAAKLSALEVGGPYAQTGAPTATNKTLLFTCGHLNGQHRPECARKILTSLAERAFRRPVTASEFTPYLRLVTEAQKQGDPFEEGLCVAVQAILVSPHFLFRIEHDTPVDRADASHPITDFELASRLSYFLWSSMPDGALYRTAKNHTLRQPAVLQAQVRRMLADPKARALADNFAGQWLELRKLESLKPDLERFPHYDEYLRFSMRRETELFFNDIIRQDSSVLDFLDGKYTFVNERLAKFYALPGVQGPEFRRVSLTGTNRGGVLTQASVLTVTSYATRTSPVLRGKWILENILNTPPPPPPPGVPSLDETKIAAGASLRQQLEEHRAKPLCASCHSRMDPLGFGLENFDAVGAWRTADGNTPVDASGTLPTGVSFSGPTQLAGVLKQQRDLFTACLTTKLMTYALGRGLERYDQPTVKQITRQVSQKDYRFSSLVLGIVNSLPFQQRKGIPTHASSNTRLTIAPHRSSGNGRNHRLAVSGRDDSRLRRGTENG